MQMATSKVDLSTAPVNWSLFMNYKIPHSQVTKDKIELLDEH